MKDWIDKLYFIDDEMKYSCFIGFLWDFYFFVNWPTPL